MKKLLLLVSILVVLLLSILLYSIKPVDDLNHQAKVDQKLVIWGYSPALIELAKEYQKSHDKIEIVTKLVENPQTLLEELYVAESAGNPPHLAEVPSFYGIAPLILSQSIVPVEDYLSADLKEESVQSIEKRFAFNGKLWAIPLGYQIPLLYVNDTIRTQNHIASANVGLEELFKAGKQIQEKNKEVWGLQSDPLYPWYILNFLKNEGRDHTQLSKSAWRKARAEYDLLPPYTYHLAITQFANGKGGVLLSTSQNLLLFEKLIGSKFKWSTFKLPIEPKNLLTNGSGLVVFKHQGSSKVEQSFLDFIMSDENLKSFAMKETFIPAYKHLINDEFLNLYRQFPGYQQAIKSSLDAEGEEILLEDKNNWKSFEDLDKNLTENR